MSFVYSLTTLSSVSLFLFLSVLALSRGSRKLPPGPSFPLLTLSTRGDKQRLWHAYTEWSRTYGPLFYFTIFGSRTLVLNSYRAVTELLEKRSWNYSDRPDMPMAVDLANWGWNMGCTSPDSRYPHALAVLTRITLKS
ncbi:hypothetical protein PM082_019212 [Marasmius tenuissimus]|nr:hypothetical protein PM082_019212 [Marasmius tenuissimus]